MAIFTFFVENPCISDFLNEEAMFHLLQFIGALVYAAVIVQMKNSYMKLVNIIYRIIIIVKVFQL